MYTHKFSTFFMFLKASFPELLQPIFLKAELFHMKL